MNLKKMAYDSNHSTAHYRRGAINHKKVWQKSRLGAHSTYPDGKERVIMEFINLNDWRTWKTITN